MTNPIQDIYDQMAEIDPEALFADGLDGAIIGYTRNPKTSKYTVVYDASKVIEVLIEEHDMTHDEAIEYADFNIFAAYVGDHTPLYVWDFDE